MVLIAEEKYRRLLSSATTSTTPRKAVEQTLPTPEPPTRDETDKIVASVPDKMKRQARTLLVYLTAAPDHVLTWSDSGELVCHGRTIPGSHISDAVNSCMRYRKFQPVGMHEFYGILRELNIPRGLITNEVKFPAKRPTWIKL